MPQMAMTYKYNIAYKKAIVFETVAFLCVDCTKMVLLAIIVGFDIVHDFEAGGEF